ncbi:Qor, NADPH:quinone reductase Zn-dependent oxidoreductase, partial [Pyrenophora tritici-repentis]
MASPRGELLVRIGENIIPIFKKEVNPLELMFGETNLMPRTYDQGFPGSIKPLLAKYLEALSFNRPNLRIMEVGAGTGSATEVILEVLGSRTTADLASIGRYHFTDLSGGFLERARKRFSKWSSLMEYDILDIERDPAAQGFQAESYDVVVATHVLHATADLQRTLANVRSLLKPGGKLLLIENMQPDLRCTPFAFGVLPGWWTSIEPDRALNPLIREDRWNEILGKSGFTSTNLILRDTEDNSAHEISVVVSTAMKSEFDAKTCGFESILAVCGSDTQLNSELVVSLVQRFHQHSVELQTCNYHNLRNMDLRNTLALVLLDLNSFDISNLTEALIWVSGDEQYNPKLSMPTGVIRTIRWERDLENINFSILRFRNPLPDIHLLSDKIVEFYCHNFDPRLGLERNGEFMFQNDSFWTNRLLHSKRVNDFLSTRFTQETHLQPLGHGLERPLKSMIRRPRQSASLEFIEDESQLLPVKPTEVKILVQACGLSSRDIMTVNGDAPGDSLGGQASGIITEVGVAVTSLKVGERVMFINPSSQNGTLQSTFRTPAGFVQKIPDDVDHVEAAAVPIAFCAAFHALHNIAKLAPKEKLLIHSAASSVGQAAIQLASLIGADIFATVSTTQMRELLINEYGVKEDHIFFSRDVLFEKGIMEITKGRGIDVVLNLLHGDALQATWRCIAPFGRFIDFRSKDILSLGKLEMGPFSRNATYTGMDISSMGYTKPSAVYQIFEEVAHLYRSQKIRCPRPLARFRYAEIDKALSQLQAGNLEGSLVVVPTEGDLVPQKITEMSHYNFPSDASYILAGGLGGLGRSIARWMASRGAKHFIFISRSGGRSDAASALIQELHNQSCQVKVVVSDVSDHQQLMKALKPCTLSMPPVKGCFQCSMVLQDSLFANMTYAQFNAAIKPKVQGSLNLIEALPRSIDFFICLSSAAAVVGNRGQANYVAANTFQDALAEHLVLTGLPGLSINLGSVLTVGWVAENQQNLPISAAFGTLSEEELLSVIEYHIDPRMKAAASVDTCHTVAGLRSSAYFVQRGLPPPAFMQFPFFSHLLPSAGVHNTDGEKEIDFPINDLLKTADSLQTAGDAVSKAIGWKLSRVMSIPTEDIDLDRSLTSYGVDSLVTVDFRTWIMKDMAAIVQASDILSEK